MWVPEQYRLLAASVNMKRATCHTWWLLHSRSSCKRTTHPAEHVVILVQEHWCIRSELGRNEAWQVELDVDAVVFLCDFLG